MSKPERLHTAAVDAAFAHGHVETELECAAMERAADHVREIAMKLDDALTREASLKTDLLFLYRHHEPDYKYQRCIVEGAMQSNIEAAALLGALELALRSHGRFKAYVEAKRALEACEAPKDA